LAGAYAIRPAASKGFPAPDSLSPVESPVTEPSVVVVVLNWNRWAATRACIESLAAMDYERKRVTVVDNGSDGPPIRSEALDLGADDFFQTGKNLGYAGGNNLGLRHAVAEGADFAWIVNNDTVADPAALSHLVAAATANPSVGVLTSNVRLPGGRRARDVALSGGPRDAPWNYFGDLHTVSCDGCGQGFHATAGVRGPSLFFRVEALADSGLLDEDYFHYYEEVDLVERLRRKGWTSGLACKAVVAHDAGATLSYETGQSIYYLFRNYLLFRKKLYRESPLGAPARQPLRFLRYVIAARHTSRGDLLPMRAHLLAFIDAVRGRHGQRRLGPAFQKRILFDR
jgi:GT2 family glycosyltransferase